VQCFGDYVISNVSLRRLQYPRVCVTNSKRKCTDRLTDSITVTMWMNIQTILVRFRDCIRSNDAGVTEGGNVRGPSCCRERNKATVGVRSNSIGI
jgi:hypothetical protein